MKNANKIRAVISVFIMLTMFAVPLAGATPCKTYTTDADFDEGTLVGVEHETVHDQLQLTATATTLPFIWVPNSNEGTVSKYDTVTGKELGRFRTGPASAGNGNPSRTTVDQDGNVWFGNRVTGTVVKIGLYENGQCVDKNGDGVITTSQDTNNDGDVTGTEVLAWGQDECVLHEVLLGSASSGPRGIAIDANKDLWAGTYSLVGGNNFYHINGATGAIIAADTISISPYSSYGALIDGNGNIWSSSLSNYVLKIDPTTKIITKVTLQLTSYGLGIDSNNHLFVAGWGQNLVAKIDVNTHAVSHAPQGDSHCRGVAVTSDGDVWIVNSYNGVVTRLDNNLNSKATINIGGASVMSTGAAVDAAGKVWACNYNDGFLHRIDPASDTIDLSKQTPGVSGGLGNHYSYSDMTGIIARSVTTKIGTWTVDYDSGVLDTAWGTVSWTSNEPAGTSVTVKVRSSNDGSTWSGWATATNGGTLSSTPGGRYLQIETTLQIISGDTSPILYDLTVCSSGGGGPTVESADVGGTPQNIFQIGDLVYAIGSGYAGSTTYNLHVVDDTIWSNGMTIPTRVTGTVAAVTTDGSGDIPVGTMIWDSCVQGKYDIVVDVDGNGQYDVGIDALDANVDVGFEAVPEFSTIAIPVASILGLLFFFNHRKRKREQ